MSSFEEIAERLRCQAVVLDFVWYFDAGQYTAMEELFAPDGIWLRRDGEIRGRHGLRAFLKARSQTWRTRHVMTNMRASLRAPDHAMVQSYVTAYRGSIPQDGLFAPICPPLVIGTCTDELRKLDGHWLISSRQMTDDFR